MASPLSPNDQKRLSVLLKNDSWEVLEKYVAFYLSAIREEDVQGTNEFETLRMLHISQGKAKGVEELFDLLEKEAFKN